jgi:hypothetical protein
VSQEGISERQDFLSAAQGDAQAGCTTEARLLRNCPKAGIPFSGDKKI